MSKDVNILETVLANSKPLLSIEEVVPVTDYVDFMQNVYNWAKTRNLTKVEFNWGDLLKNCTDEWVEGAEARTRLCKANIALINPKTKVSTYQVNYQKTCMNDVIDAWIDGLIYVAVDAFKRDTPLGIEIVEGVYTDLQPSMLAQVTDPASYVWLYNQSVLGYYMVVGQLISMEGYEAVDCFTECFKELSTRRGDYSIEKGKWVKSPSVGTYKADYSQYQYEQ